MSITIKNNWVRVVEEMIVDPEATLNEIAQRTDIPQSTVWYAQKRLKEDGLLRTLTFLQLDELDGVKVGLIGGAINGDKDVVLEKVAAHPNVWFLVDTVGPHSFTAGIAAKGQDEFQAVIETLNGYGAEGDHYGEVTNIREFGLDSEFVGSLSEGTHE